MLMIEERDSFRMFDEIYDNNYVSQEICVTREH